MKNYFAPVGFNERWKWGEPEWQRARSAYLRNDGTQRVMGVMGSVYSSCALAELHLRLDRFNDFPWYWDYASSRIGHCFQQRPAGAAAYLHELEACKEQTPKAIVVAGVDSCPYNGQTEECRRFAAGYYAMPERPFRRIETVTGIDARVADGGYLRLYSLAGDTLEGELSCSAPYESAQVAGLGGRRHVVTVPPYSLIVLRAQDEKATWKGAFTTKSSKTRKREK